MKNDKRRITAKERADVVIETYAGIFANFDTFWFRRFLIKEFGRHVKAAHKRHARKNVCITKNGLDKETIIGLKTRFNARG